MSKHNSTFTTDVKSSANRAHKEFSEFEIRSAIIEAAHNDGVFLPHDFKFGPAPGNKPWRYQAPDDAPGEKTLFALIHADGRPAGIYGHFRSGTGTIKWKMPLPEDTKPRTTKQQAAYDAKVEENRKHREAEAAREAEEQVAKDADAAKRAEEFIAKAEKATDDHPALKRKGVKAHGVYCADHVTEWENPATGEVITYHHPNSLIVPGYRMGEDGKPTLATYQAIYPEKIKGRDKDFPKDMPQTDVFSPLQPGALKRNGEDFPTIIIGEGYSTCATIKECTGRITLVAFSASNMPAVATIARKKYPSSRIIIAADHDRFNPASGNPGIKWALLAAEAAGGLVTIAIPNPQDLAEGEAPTDFNDLAQRKGGTERGAVSAAFDVAIENPADAIANAKAIHDAAEIERKRILAEKLEKMRLQMDAAKAAAQIQERTEPTEAPDMPEPPLHDGEPAQADGEQAEADTEAEAADVTASTKANNKPSDESLEPEADHPSDCFVILGQNKGAAYFLDYETNQTSDFSLPALMQEPTQIALAPLDFWEREFPGGKGHQGGHDRKAAGNWLIRKSKRKGIFTGKKIRGRGAWMDSGSHVMHLGEILLVDGKVTAIPQMKSKSGFVYEMVEGLPAPAETALTDSEGMHLLSVCQNFRWEQKVSAYLAAGWIALAPICGVLGWRPHIWVTGEAHCGKTTFVNSFAYPLVNKMASFHQGNSTEAGIRQDLMRDARPVIVDESESNDESDRKRVAGILTLARQSSSDSEAKTHKGTIGGKSMAFDIRSMFLLSSIQVGLDKQADIERFARLTLLKPGGPDRQEAWEALENDLHKIVADPTIGARFMRRVLKLWPITMKNVRTFRVAAGKHFKNQRDGDQYGVLMAGAWSLINSTEATEDDALDMLKQHEWKFHRPADDIDQPTKAFNAMKNGRVNLHGVPASILELIEIAAEFNAPGEHLPGYTLPIAQHMLRREGYVVWRDDSADRPANAPEWFLLIEAPSESITKMLKQDRDSSHVVGWEDQLKHLGAVPHLHRHGDKKGKPWPVKFNNAARCLELPLDKVIPDFVSRRSAQPPM